ncbi:unnamed protein product, partial [Iphiclides podalirius]
MTVKKATRSGGYAAIVSRQKLHSSNQQIDMTAVSKSAPLQTYNITVCFNEKDQLQLLTKEETKDDDKQKQIKEYNDFATSRYENIAIDDIANCVNIENYPNCDRTLVFYVNRNINAEAIAIRFENEQDFKRIYFTYKYFKMRNRLTKNTGYTSSENLFSKKRTADLFKGRKNSIEDYGYDKARSGFDVLKTTDSDGLTHMSVQQKGSNRFEQPLSLIGFRNESTDTGEIDSIIYTDVDIPTKPERKRFFHKKAKAPSPPLLPSKDAPKVLRGELCQGECGESAGRYTERQ